MNVRDLAKARVIVIGDAMIDRWVWGHYSKIGPEGVPVFLQEKCEDRPGGAANVVANLEALGCDTQLFAKPFEQRPVKIRYAATGAVFRSDREDCSPIDETLVRGFMGFLERIARPHVLVISDYAKGVCTPSLCQQLIGWAKAKGVKVVVDPKGDDWSKYAGADVITPNEAEWEPIRVHGTGGYPLNVLVTLGAKGMRLIKPMGMVEIPATAREVYDVTGAGDTVVAVLAAALAVGFDLESAARMANVAAGVVVGKRGTATCSLEELEAAYKPAESALPSHHWDGSPRTSQRPYSSMDAVMLGCKKPVVGFTNGCFDLLHEGHRHFLRECQKLCDVLIVAMNSDASVRQLKGRDRPICNWRQRRDCLVPLLRAADCHGWFDSEIGLLALIKKYEPDIIFKGQEYETKDVVGADLAQVVLIPMLEGYSTTLEIARRA